MPVAVGVEEEVGMSLVSRNDHFVPAFYLIKFTDTGKRNGQLWQFDGVNGSTTVGRPKALGKALDYHTVEIDGQPPDFLEKHFSKIESAGSRVMRAIDESGRLPSRKSELADFMMFVALSYYRGPQHRHFLTTFYDETETLKIRIALSDPALWDHYVRACIKHGIPYPVGTYHELNILYRRDEATFPIQNPGQIHTVSMTESLEWLFNTLMNRRWGIEIATDPGDFFITSDTPASVTWIDPKDYSLGPCGLGYSRTEVALPLSKRMALVGRFDDVPDSKEADGNRVAAINFATAHAAHRFVYGPIDDFVFMPPDGVWYTVDDWFAYRTRTR